LIITASGVQPLSVEKQLENQQARQAIIPEPAPDNEPPSGPKKKVSKRAVTLDPAHTSPEIVQATQRLRGQVEKVFRRQRDKARDTATRLLKGKLEAAWSNSSRTTGRSSPSPLSRSSSSFTSTSCTFVKAENDKPEEIADDIYASIAPDFQDIPPEARAAIEQAVLAGISKGMLDLGTADSKLIGSANRTAADYAAERAAELVGMKYDAEGNLVENPNAEWAITDTTRDRLREIVKNAFEQDTPISELIDNIADADSFSEQRAELIARTEVSMAQVKGNYEVWKQSGLVRKVKWLISADHDIEDECDSNGDEEVEFGQVFPSGDLTPPAHPRCMCVLVATEIAG
ncbi:MAG TPA: phage minor head protein, partial [Terriglobia bacterium]|nr:phage minor head protein [Terriglobia bacterium]